jgi:hypothetical protein
MQRATSRLSPRIAARYRLARLLTEEQFENALEEATRAHADGEILGSDLRFVTGIVDAARSGKDSTFFK